MITDAERNEFQSKVSIAMRDAIAHPNASQKLAFSVAWMEALSAGIVESALQSLNLGKAHTDEVAKAALHRADRQAEHIARLETRLQKLERSK